MVTLYDVLTALKEKVVGSNPTGGSISKNLAARTGLGAGREIFVVYRPPVRTRRPTLPGPAPRAVG